MLCTFDQHDYIHVLLRAKHCWREVSSLIVVVRFACRLTVVPACSVTERTAIVIMAAVVIIIVNLI